MLSDFETMSELAVRIRRCEQQWREEAHALEHGHTYCLRGPNHDLPHCVARGYADQLAQLLKAIDDIQGPPEA